MGGKAPFAGLQYFFNSYEETTRSLHPNRHIEVTHMGTPIPTEEVEDLFKCGRLSLHSGWDNESIKIDDLNSCQRIWKLTLFF